MAAYFIKYSYTGYDDRRYNKSCIIDYERFEKVNRESFYRKFNEVIKKEFSYNCSPSIESVTKL